MLGKVIGGALDSLFGGGGVSIDFEAVEGAMGEITTLMNQFEDEVNGPIQQRQARVDEFWRGSGAEHYKDVANNEIFNELQDIPSELQNLHSSLSSTLNSFKEADKGIFESIGGFLDGIF